MSLTEVQWKGESVPIRNQQVRVALIKINQTVSEVRKEESVEEKMILYEQLLMDCQDAVQMIRDDMNQDKVYTHTLLVTSTCIYMTVSEKTEPVSQINQFFEILVRVYIEQEQSDLFKFMNTWLSYNY